MILYVSRLTTLCSYKVTFNREPDFDEEEDEESEEPLEEGEEGEEDFEDTREFQHVRYILVSER